MEKRNKIILGAIIILTIIVISICIYSIINNNHINKSDANKFRTEYMELNDKINEDNGQAYPIVNISADNTVKYIKPKESVKMLKEDSGIIYFGYNTCPWCRSLVSILTEVASEKKEKVYYVDIADIRSTFTVDNGKLTKNKKGTKDYYNILKELDNYLEEYFLEDEDGNKYDTKEKRLYAPTIVAVSGGNVTGVHIGTVSSQKNGYDKLTEDEIKELENIITDLIMKKNEVVCAKENNC